nr:hypothetical protein BN1046_00293 [Bartonella schoenbuchensis]CDP79471.1 hypothetical protein BN1046_00365 [Bartonella schoenbuchensis]
MIMHAINASTTTGHSHDHHTHSIHTPPPQYTTTTLHIASLMCHSTTHFHPMSIASTLLGFHTSCIHPMHASPPIGTLEKPSLQHHPPQPLPHDTNRCTLRAKPNPDHDDASRVNVNASTTTGYFHDNRALPT